MRRLRTVAGWLPAVLLVPAALVALVQVTVPSDADRQAMDQVLPLDPGTTWVYAVSDHGRPSGQRVRQVLGPSQLIVGTLRNGVRISSVYDDYPGRGRQSIDAYLGVEGRELLQYGLIGPSGHLAIDPPAPAYTLPAEVGTSWSYEGTLGPRTELRSTTEVTDEGEVEVRGHTFTGCTEWTTNQEVPDTDGEVEVLTEWTCPGIGVVRSTDVYEAGGVDITEELVAFHGVDRQWTAEDTGRASRRLGGESADGLDQARSRSVPDAELTGTLDWTDSRSRTSTFSPVGDETVEVVGEPDGLVSAQDVRSGETLWQVGLPPPVVAAPAVGGGLVFVADGAKNLWALSLRDGTAQWVHHFDDVVSTVPVVGDDAIAVTVEDGSLVALSRADGEVLWSAALGARAASAPALAGDRAVVADGSGAVTAFDLSSGDEEWSVALEEGLEQGPTVAGSLVLAVDGEGVLNAFDLADGGTRWQALSRDFPALPLAAGADRVVTVGDDGWVEAFGLGDGSRAWARKVGDLETAPVVVGDDVVVVTVPGRVRLLDAERGSPGESWALPPPLPGAALEVQAPLAVVGDSLVVTAEVEDGGSGVFRSTSYAYRFRDDGSAPGVAFDSRVHTFPLPPATPVVVDRGAAYALCIDGVLYRDAGSGPEPVLGDIAPRIGFAAADGVVVVPRGEEVWAVRGSDGEKLWSLPTGSAYVESVPAISGDTAFVPIQGVGLAAVGLRRGDVRWLAQTPGALGSTTPLPLPGGDVVHAADGLVRYDGRTGAEVWRLGGDLAGAVAYTRIAESEGTVYAVLVSAADDGSERSRLVAVEAASGRVHWQRDVAGAPFGIPPVAADGTVVVVDGANRALVIDSRTGAVRWVHALGTAPAGAPTVHDGMVVLTQRGRAEDLKQRDFRLTVQDALTGRFLASYQPPAASDSTLPTVGAGPRGRTLVPTIGAEAAYVVELEGRRG